MANALRPLSWLLLVFFDQIPSHYDKFIDVAAQDLQYTTAIFLLLIAAVAYLGSEWTLKLAKATRPHWGWIVFAIGIPGFGLLLNLYSYFELENALLQNRVHEFGLYWQWARWLVFCLLLAASIAVFATYRRFRG